jgi:hypothetical protein
MGKWKPTDQVANSGQSRDLNLDSGVHAESVQFRDRFKPHFGEFKDYKYLTSIIIGETITKKIRE